MRSSFGLFTSATTLLLLLVLAPCLARAESILIESGPVLTTVVGGFKWDYTVQEVGSTKTVQTGDFFTIVDFVGYVAGSIFAPVGWVGTTPPVVGIPDTGQPGNYKITGSNGSVSVPDSPGWVDLLFTYIGVAPIPAGTLGHFGAVSTTSVEIQGNLMAMDHNGANSVVNSDVPLVPGTPLPSTASLGLLLLCGIAGWEALRRFGWTNRGVGSSYSEKLVCPVL